MKAGGTVGSAKRKDDSNEAIQNLVFIIFLNNSLPLSAEERKKEENSVRDTQIS